MAASDWNMHNDLIAHLKSVPCEYSLYQAIYLLEAATEQSARVCTFDRLYANADDCIFITNDVRLSTSAAQLISCTESSRYGRQVYQLLTTDQGLYGELSPLPTLYSLMLSGSDPDSTRERDLLREFLDLFNSRYFALAYRADNYRHIHRSRSASAFETAVLSCSGISISEDQSVNAATIGRAMNAPHLCSLGPKSSVGLILWLNAIYPDVNFAIVENYPVWCTIPENERSALGRANCYLRQDFGGNGVVLGDQLSDQETHFHVVVGPVRWTVFVGLLPGRASLQELHEAIDDYCPDWLSFDFRLILIGKDCKHLVVCLDGTTSQLGFTTGLFDAEGSNADLELVFCSGFDHEESHYRLGTGVNHGEYSEYQ